MGKYNFGVAWNRDSVLLVFKYSNFYGIYKCRIAAWSNIFVFDIFTDGRFGKFGIVDEHLWRGNCICLCYLRTCDCGNRRYAYRKMHMETYVEEFIRNASHVESDSPTITKRERVMNAKEQVQWTFRKVFPYILVGVGIGAIIHNWIPQTWIESILGSNNPFGVVLATLVGIPMYADIFGTIPIAEALLVKGAQLGTILSFMMAVTTLSLPSMIMLKKAVKPKLLGVFITICATGIIIVGYVFNAFHVF